MRTDPTALLGPLSAPSVRLGRRFAPPLLAGLAAFFMATATALAGDGASAQSVHDFTVEDIDGHPVDLGQYQGKVLLVVNVASQCGFTRQYAGLQALYAATKDQGVVVLGFPSNDFGGQEPGTNAEIKLFCRGTYDVTFPMFSKISVKPGSQQHPLYQYLTSQAGEVSWNFNKFLVGKDGQVSQRFDSGVAPDSDTLREALGAAL